MSKIQTIKDKDGNIVYPQTAVQAIYDESGKTLNTVLTDFVKVDEAGSSVENVNNNSELIANKVTSIDSSSTDIQYPSAKAVYTSILANKSVGIKISVVDELPTENIDDKTMYLKSNGTSETQNIYDEYLYVNNNWEHIGSTATTIDLSEYLKVSDADKGYLQKKTGSEMAALADFNTADINNNGMIVLCTVQGATNYQQGHIYVLTIYAEQGAIEAIGWGDITSTYYQLPTASAETLGGIKIGNGLSVNDSGVVSVNSSGGTDSDIINIIQGTENKTTVFNNNVITETTDDIVMTTTFNDDGSITETRTSTKYGNISKKTVFNNDGSITETILS